jgi:gluconolactonase
VLSRLAVFLNDAMTPEAPVALPDGGWLFTEMGRGCVSHVPAGGEPRKTLATTGRPNGLAVSADDTVWIAESRHPALLRLRPGAATEVVTAGYPDNPIRWPNDLCLGPDGMIYMTDSGVLFADFEGITSPEEAYKIPIDGKVLRIDPNTRDYVELDSGLQFANGIAFGIGGEYLYISETLTGNIYRYRHQKGAASEREYFGNVMQQPPRSYGRVAGPDGMAFDADGNLYVAVLVEGTIIVLKPDGTVKDRIHLPGHYPTNLAFSQTHPTQAVITESEGNQLLHVDLPVPGLPLFS